MRSRTFVDRPAMHGKSWNKPELNTQCLSANIPVSYEVEEGGEGTRGVIAHVLELCHELLAQFVVDHGDLERRRHVGQEIAVVGRLKVQFQI